MATKNNQADTAAPDAGQPVDPAVVTPAPNPAMGGCYELNPATGATTLVKPSTEEVQTRKVIDQATGSYKRIPVKE